MLWDGDTRQLGAGLHADFKCCVLVRKKASEGCCLPKAAHRLRDCRPSGPGTAHRDLADRRSIILRHVPGESEALEEVRIAVLRWARHGQCC
eukprot:scaffold2041_cov251-Pinguiococcus_pyrenoidosus.AAC.7